MPTIALLALEAADGTVVLTSITLVFAMLVALCLIIDVAVQTYGEDLAVDHQMDSLLDDTFIQQQEDMFAMLLVEMQQHPPRVALAGYRDEGHVIVYNR